MLIYYKQQSYFSQIVSKEAKITILFWVLVLCIWFQFIQRIEHYLPYFFVWSD